MNHDRMDYVAGLQDQLIHLCPRCGRRVFMIGQEIRYCYHCGERYMGEDKDKPVAYLRADLVLARKDEETSGTCWQKDGVGRHVFSGQACACGKFTRENGWTPPKGAKTE